MRVLVATDGSNCSYMAIESVCRRPWPDDTEFLVFSVADSPYLEYGLYPPPEGIIENVRRDLERVVNNAVETIQKQFPALSVKGRVEEGSVRYIIAEVARQWNADLIVIGSHGRRGLGKLLLGSIAEGVLHLSPCSVEIVREKQQGAKKQREQTQEDISDQSTGSKSLSSCDRVI